MRGNSGFTLIELILVTVIIGILAGAVALNVKGRVTQAGVARAKSDIAVYESAIDMFAVEHQDEYPKSLNELASGDKKYIKLIKKDPWGNPYVYVNPGKKNQGGYDLSSNGPDKIANNADDINNWTAD